MGEWKFSFGGINAAVAGRKMGVCVYFAWQVINSHPYLSPNIHKSVSWSSLWWHYKHVYSITMWSRKAEQKISDQHDVGPHFFFSFLSRFSGHTKSLFVSDRFDSRKRAQKRAYYRSDREIRAFLYSASTFCVVPHVKHSRPVFYVQCCPFN